MLALMRGRALRRSLSPETVVNNLFYTPSITQTYSFATIAAERMRNVAIIAHVDHGKTTLVDKLFEQSQGLKMSGDQERLMDSNPLEQERGITILSKSTSVVWDRGGTLSEPYHLNIVDTPGHADFGGEVERIMSMVDGVCLLVDATSGPMTQTKFVLSKALQRGLRPLLVFNKADRDTSRIGAVEGEVFDLFDHLSATDEQMDFPYLYASAKEGWAVEDMKEEKKDLTPLFDLIISHIPPPSADAASPFSMLVTQTYNHTFFGKCALGRVSTGQLKIGDSISCIKEDGSPVEDGRAVKFFQQRGMEEIELESISAGNIVAIAGLRGPRVNDTLCAKSVTEPLKAIPIDPPSLAMTISTNSSPLAGQEGNAVPSAQLGEWLLKESENNVSITVSRSEAGDSFEVFGRGELQLGIIVENMRRAGFELSVSPPRVLFKKSRENPKQVLEPMEEVIIDVEQSYAGRIIELLSLRKGNVMEYTQSESEARLVLHVPTRGLLGFRGQFVNETGGNGIMNTSFEGYVPYLGQIERSNRGALCASHDGTATTYALASIEQRGTLFIKPGDKVYCGMVVGEHTREVDLEVNAVKAKALNNMRAAGKDETVRLAPPRMRSLEEAIATCRENELLECTPKSVRLRKSELDAKRRLKGNKATAKQKSGPKPEEVTAWID